MPQPSTDKSPAGSDAQHEPGLVEIGWLDFDNLDEVARKAIEVCRERVTKYLQQRLPQFHWRIAVETREAPQREPAESLQWARGQGDVRGWDYAYIAERSSNVHAYIRSTTSMPSSASPS